MKVSVFNADRSLNARHLEQLLDSGIALAVIKERGYFSASSSNELRKLGFSPSQSQIGKSLIIPIWSVNGKRIMYQMRPDIPRTQGEKVSKYEMPFGSKSVLDVPKRAIPGLNDIGTPLWVTEGIKKADSAVSHGLCCISLFGVWNWQSKDGGKESVPLSDWNSIGLSHRRVHICFDSDVMTNPKVAQALRNLRSMLRSRNATVVPIYLPAKEGQKVGLDDFFANGGTVEELQFLTKRPKMANELGGIRSDLPTIETHNIQLAPNVDEALDALLQANEPPVIFNYSGRLTRLRIEETNRKDVPRLEAMGKDMMIDQLSRAANFISVSSQGKRSVNPPDVLARMIMAQADWEGLPKLNGLVTSPIFSKDGTLATATGYSPATKMIYFEPLPLKIPDTTPTIMRVKQSSQFLRTFLTDFPFADNASYAHAVAFLIMPFVREMIEGPTPLFLFDAPRAGTGKSLLMSVLASVFLPSSVSLQAAPKDEEEWRKRITTILRDGSSHFLLDNIRDLSSESLQAALTAPDCLWKDRLLGGNDSLLLPIRCIWAATANNITGTLEQLRRCIQIRIDSRTEKPEERKNFRHPDIRSWVRNNRHAIIRSVLVLVRGWIEEGQPDYSGINAPMGSFEAWTNVLGGILETAEISGFLDNRRNFTEQSDSEQDTVKAFVADWSKNFGKKEVKARDLTIIARHYFDREIGEGNERSQAIRLGKLLSSHRDQVVGGLIIKVRQTDSGALYSLSAA